MAHEYTIKLMQNEAGKVGAEGRVATLCSPDNTNFIRLNVQSPAEFLGPGDENGKSLYWTPEDLFVSSVAVCLFTTFIKIAQNSNLVFSNFQITAKGFLEETEEGNRMTRIEQKVILTIPEEKHKRKAHRIVEKAEESCLIANSIKSKVTADIEIVVEK